MSRGRLMLEICAARLDSNVSAEEFVDLLEKLVGAPRSSDRERVSRAATPQNRTAPVVTPARRVVIQPPTKPKKGPRCKITYDDRVRIRMRADEARGDGNQLPSGFVSGLAAEHLVSDQTIYNILKGEQ